MWELFQIKNYIIYLAYALTICLILLQVSILDGFLSKHEGWAGPHLTSVSINLTPTDGYYRHDVMYADGSSKSYNHHPPLYFFIQHFFLKDLKDPTLRLNRAYILSGIFLCLGLIAIHLMLTKIHFHPRTAFITSVTTLGIPLWLTHTPIITFDSANILFSGLLIFSFASILSNKCKRNLLLFATISSVAILTSWYAVFPVFSCGGYLLFLQIKRQGTRRFWSQSEFQICFFIGIFSASLLGYLAYEEKVMFGEITAIGRSFKNNINLINELPSDTQKIKFDTINYMLVIKSALQTFLSPALLILILFLSICAKPKALLNRLKRYHAAKPHRLTTALVPFAGTVLFIITTAQWSSTHNFAFLWFIPPFAILIAAGVEFLQKNSTCLFFIFIVLNVLCTALSFAYFTNSRLKSQENTMRVLEWMQEQDSNQPIAWILPKDTSFPGPCGKYSGGALIFIGSSPNTFAKTFDDISDGYRKLKMVCDRTIPKDPNLKILDEQNNTVFNDQQ